jgi:endonuclease-3
MLDINETIQELKEHYPNVKPSLNYKNNFELLVAVILSAQCTDARVNIVTEKLFKKYTSVEDYANVDLEKLMQDIKSTGFYRNKAKNIQATAKLLLEKYDGQVPKTMDELLELKGVARKTANIVLYHGMGIIDGIAVDTHVKRLSNRFGWVKTPNPEKIEKELMKILPKEEWGNITDLMIYHGRALCKAPSPKCSDCFLKDKCPSSLTKVTK